MERFIETKGQPKFFPLKKFNVIILIHPVVLIIIFLNLSLLMNEIFEFYRS